MPTQEQKPYAKYDVLPTLGYNVVSNLMNNSNAEIIWKLLKDKTPDAWNITNLTIAEKRALIYKGSEDAQNFAIFFDSGMDNSITDESIYLRIYPYSGNPLNPYTGIVDIAFEMLCHYKINTLSNYTTRVDSIMSALLDCLNGADIGGLGRLYFDASRSRNNKFQNFNQVPFKAKILIMGINVA
jgi:hypothetical protein